MGKGREKGGEKREGGGGLLWGWGGVTNRSLKCSQCRLELNIHHPGFVLEERTALIGQTEAEIQYESMCSQLLFPKKLLDCSSKIQKLLLEIGTSPGLSMQFYLNNYNTQKCT